MPFLLRHIALLAVPLALGGCFERVNPVAEQAPLPVQVVHPAPIDQAAGRSYVGVLRARREADVGFRAGGRVLAREVDVGARVTAGQVLARLDPADLALAVRSAQADLSAAEAQAAQAASDAARSAKLRAAGWTAAQADEVKQAADRAAREKVASAQAALELTRNRLDYAVLKAPADGVVMASYADPGTVVAEGQAVLRLAEAGALEAEVALPERDVAEASGAAMVSLWARPDEAVPAHLREVSPTADAKLRTYTARYALEAAPPWLAYGMSATVTLPARAAGTGLTEIPLSALADRGQGPVAWVVSQGGVVARPVSVKALRQDRAVVTGLDPADEVVAMGVQKLDPAVRVRVADRRAAVGG